MRSFSLGPKPPASVLCLGAHADDIEIGCGGTLLTLRAQYPELRVHWAVLSAFDCRAVEARRGATLFVGGGPHDVELCDFPDGFFPAEWAAIKTWFADLARRVRPDIVFTHAGQDRHQDHRIVSELTWNHFRDHVILEYEIPKFDADLGSPNVFVPLFRRDLEAKIANLMAAFPTQREKPWFTAETFRGLAHIRGNECRASQGVAEAFFARKIVLGP